VNAAGVDLLIGYPLRLDREAFRNGRAATRTKWTFLGFWQVIMASSEWERDRSDVSTADSVGQLKDSIHGNGSYTFKEGSKKISLRRRNHHRSRHRT
jgi:hypothetical protein